jgi:calcineurin-like phosphoesterase family protein
MNENPWVISDTHFFHERIQGYCNRPNGWQDLIIKNWNKAINHRDYVLHLGDLAMGHTSKCLELRKYLKGEVFIIKGNHDRLSSLENSGFYPINSFVWNEVLFSHQPKYVNVPFPEEIKFNIHGHIHEKENVSSRHYNVSIERMNYQPIRLIDLLDKINNYDRSAYGR